MHRSYKATRVKTSPLYLSVLLTIEVGTALRFAEVKVPWRMLAGHYQDVMDGMEHEFAKEIRAQEERDQPQLPGID